MIQFFISQVFLRYKFAWAFYKVGLGICLNYAYFRTCLHKFDCFYRGFGSHKTVVLFYSKCHYISGLFLAQRIQKVNTFQKLWSFKGWMLHDWKQQTNFHNFWLIGDTTHLKQWGLVSTVNSICSLWQLNSIWGGGGEKPPPLRSRDLLDI